MQTVRGNRISMVFQEPMTSLNPIHTCGKQIAESVMLHSKVSKKVAMERALELLKPVSYTHLLVAALPKYPTPQPIKI